MPFYHDVVVSKVIDPETGEAVAIEIVANDGKVYFATRVDFMEGLRVGSFPNDSNGKPLQRVEIVSLK